ncbi:hypothetical protein [Streptomyces sp. NBC_00569]|uniref:hypothetical protein n=1 Tax=Streptomyces sp. NBC_00569 TaxID=2975780 RepID=UPI003FCCF37F
MQILCHSRPGRICRGGGLVPRAKRDVEEGVAAGRSTVVDPVLALTAPNGSLPALLKLWCNQPAADSGQAAGTMVEMVLHMLGLSPDEARDLARRHPPPRCGVKRVLSRTGRLAPTAGRFSRPASRTGVAGISRLLSPPRPQSWMGRWRGPRSMAFCR